MATGAVMFAAEARRKAANLARLLELFEKD